MASAWLLHPLRVRYQECDQMGVVYHANYVNWFEIGRTEWVRRIGCDYREIETRGLLLPLVKLDVNFVQPARYDEWITVCTRVADKTALRIEFESRIVKGDLTATVGRVTKDEPAGELLVSGGTKHVWVNKEWKPVRLDRELPEVWAAFKALAEA
ncbi:acyl-CoA thioester hydrolase [Cohnella sp. OV330]|uniref:acyl-CoA thioesterase n=1 Tax=Cohnella sp. OV330 TaxID=1855288 RepID=UPI0008ED0245|nr:thioesterase family protein [Cohnella sp. OV330]SFA90477.1 acyl-CoA thioester hydrolase [Cohnella sp. OV330]